jgi:hypothetical protein
MKSSNQTPFTRPEPTRFNVVRLCISKGMTEAIGVHLNLTEANVSLGSKNFYAENVSP